MAMKNPEPFKTGVKPAPGELVVIQGFINTLDIEGGTDDIATKELFEEWLRGHNLPRGGIKISTADFETALRLRESIRSLLIANNGEHPEIPSLSEINNLLSRFRLTIAFEKNGLPSLIPVDRGINGVFAHMLSLINRSVIDGTWFRLKACIKSGCQWAFYDASKNHSGRWCSMSICGSREKARSYRKRQSLRK